MNKEYRLAWRNAPGAHVAVAVIGVVRGKRISGIRTLARVVLAAVVAGSLGTAHAGGHILGIEGAVQAGDRVQRVGGAPQATAGVPMPPRITGVRGWF